MKAPVKGAENAPFLSVRGKEEILRGIPEKVSLEKVFPKGVLEKASLEKVPPEKVPLENLS
ncbi:MAG: hypothetical protein RSA20_01755 [Oscillospiraceae bacterium]